MEDLVFQYTEDVPPGLLTAIFSHNLAEKVLIEVELDESVALNTPYSGRFDPVVAVHIHLLELLDDVSVELLVTSEVYHALQKVFGYIGFTLL